VLGWCGPARGTLGPTLEPAWCEALGAVRVDDQLGKFVAGPGRLEPTQGINETDAPDIDILATGSLQHHLAHHVVDQGKHLQFAQDAVDRLALEHVHLVGAKYSADIESLWKYRLHARQQHESQTTFGGIDAAVTQPVFGGLCHQLIGFAGCVRKPRFVDGQLLSRGKVLDGSSRVAEKERPEE